MVQACTFASHCSRPLSSTRKKNPCRFSRNLDDSHQSFSVCATGSNRPQRVISIDNASFITRKKERIQFTTSFHEEEALQQGIVMTAVAMGVSLSLASTAIAASPVSEIILTESVASNVQSLKLNPSFRLGLTATTSERSQDLIFGETTKTKAFIPPPDTSLNAPQTVTVSVSSPSSDLVAIAALGSVASTTGRMVGQSSSQLHQVAVFPGGQLLARLLQHLGSGGVAGAVGATVVYPLDTLKTRMQAQSSKEGEEPMYKDEIDCFKQLVTQEGLGSLYSGLMPQLLGIAPEKALKLTVNEILMEMLENLCPGAGLFALEFIAGGGGGFSQVLVTNPMEIVKVRLQIQSKDGSSKTLWQVAKELGLGGLYCGSAITLARDVPSSAIFFSCYALLRQLYPDHCFWAACLAAIPATVLVTPFDVIKTRLQVEPPPGEKPYENAWHCFRVTIQKEGPRALFKGGLLRVLRASPQFGITLMLYSLICHGS